MTTGLGGVWLGSRFGSGRCGKGGVFNLFLGRGGYDAVDVDAWEMDCVGGY